MPEDGSHYVGSVSDSVLWPQMKWGNSLTAVPPFST